MKNIDPDNLNDALVARLLAGDSAARNELIVANQRLVYTTVNRVLCLWTNLQYLHDDLIGEGMLTLVLAVDRLVEIGDVAQPIRNYLITAIRNRLITMLIGQANHYQTTQYLDSYHRIPEHTLAKDDPVFARIEDRDFFMSLCETGREREILSYYLAGQKPIDIIHRADFSRAVVHNTLQQFRQKLRESQESLTD